VEIHPERGERVNIQIGVVPAIPVIVISWHSIDENEESN
jgi:hypothetical protein